MSAVLDLFNVLHEPMAVFLRVKERPRILLPWLALSVLLMALAYATVPYQAAAMEAFRASLPAEQAARMGAAGGPSAARTLIVPPVITIIGLLIGAGLLWIGVSIVGGQARYRALLSVLAYCFITYVLFQAVTAAVLMVRGVGAVSSFADLRAPVGLDLLAPGAGLFLGTFLNGINPFSVWGVWLCGTGVSITQETSRGTGIVIAAVAFLIGLLLVSAPTLLMGMATRQ